ncbi:MAG TPA: hypothetical protein VFN05_04835 [Actinomycetes bacterium]|nr:hypothetical protein [Actinomycetes bacterium]
MGVQVGPEQAQVGQAAVGQEDGVAGVDVDPVGGVPGRGRGQGRDRGAGRLVQPGLGPVLGDVKETGEAADPRFMGIGERIGIGRDGGPRWRWPRDWLRRPAGIRNGALLLVLVALAAVAALVDGPPG